LEDSEGRRMQQGIGAITDVEQHGESGKRQAAWSNGGWGTSGWNWWSRKSEGLRDVPQATRSSSGIRTPPARTCTSGRSARYHGAPSAEKTCEDIGSGFHRHTSSTGDNRQESCATPDEKMKQQGNGAQSLGDLPRTYQFGTCYARYEGAAGGPPWLHSPCCSTLWDFFLYLPFVVDMMDGDYHYCDKVRPSGGLVDSEASRPRLMQHRPPASAVRGRSGPLQLVDIAGICREGAARDHDLYDSRKTARPCGPVTSGTRSSAKQYEAVRALWTW
jgi:hypothetical protein